MKRISYRQGIVGVLLASLVAAGCGEARDGGGDNLVPSPTADATVVPVPSATPGRGGATTGPTPTGGPGSPRPMEGAPIEATAATLRVEMWQGSRGFVPRLAYGDRILFESFLRPMPGNGDADDDSQYLLWDPATGQFSPAWPAPPGLQDIIAGTDGEWVATVRTGKSLPFARWSLILRNLGTGESRTIAEADPRVVETRGLRPQLPFGFAPFPSISRGQVVWDAIEVDAEGEPRDRVYLYDVKSASTTLLYEVQDPRTEEIYSPSIGGNRVAWMRRATPDSTFEIVVRDLSSRQDEVITGVGGPYSAALSEDGRYLAWDDGMVAKWALDLETGKRVLYSEATAGELIGWGTTVSGHYVSWAPNNSRPGGKGGFYDFETGVVRFIDVQRDANMNNAQVMGAWFVWQHRPALDSPEPAYYYFLPLD